MTKIQHLMQALHHLNEAGGPEFDLMRRQLQIAITAIYTEKTENLTGTALVDRLTDEELAAAIRIREERLELYFGSQIEPGMFNYIRHQRPQVAQAEFSRRY